MKVSDLHRELGLKPLNEVFDQEFTGVFISDMVSDIVAGAEPGNLLVTIQTHKNLIATANLVDVAAVVFVRGKRPSDEVLQLADRARITLFSTDRDAWKLALALHEHGVE